MRPLLPSPLSIPHALRAPVRRVLSRRGREAAKLGLRGPPKWLPVRIGDRLGLDSPAAGLKVRSGKLRGNVIARIYT